MGLRQPASDSADVSEWHSLCDCFLQAMGGCLNEPSVGCEELPGVFSYGDF